MPVEKGQTIQYSALKSRQLTKLFRDLKLLVIDEFSFLSYELLRAVHCRLQEIYGNEELFGDCRILLVGMLDSDSLLMQVFQQ